MSDIHSTLIRTDGPIARATCSCGWTGVQHNAFSRNDNIVSASRDVSAHERNVLTPRWCACGHVEADHIQYPARKPCKHRGRVFHGTSEHRCDNFTPSK